MVRTAVAIVTGAARGIGLATAQRLATRGFRVAAVDMDVDELAGAALPEGVGPPRIDDIAVDALVRS